MSEFRFKGKNTILIPMAIVVLVMTIPFFVMSVKGLLNMGPDDNKTLQIVGVAVMGALVPIALVNLIHSLIFRVVVEDTTIKIRGVFGTKRMDIHNGIQCTCELKGSVGNSNHPRSLHHVITLVDGVNKIKFKLTRASDVEQFIFIMKDAGVNVQRNDLI